MHINASPHGYGYRSNTSPYHIQSRAYSVTPKPESAAIALGLGAVAATAKAGQYAVAAYKEWKDSQPEEPIPSPDNDANANDNDNATQDQPNADADADANANASNKDAKKKDQKGENIFSQYFSVGSKYYEGGFEDKMTKREAALILGVRESSTPKRIKEAHRNLLILNHPDTGGSTFLSGKINEAKDLLLKGQGRVKR